jgi:hypothetical protein
MSREPDLLRVLGLMKWPTLIAVLVLPTWFYFDGWRDGWNGEPLAVYSAEVVAGLPLVPMHSAGADPLEDATTAWQLRLCADCTRRMRSVRLAHGGCVNAPNQWTAAQGQDGRLTARVDRAALSIHDAVCVWVEVEAIDGSSGLHRWTLRAAPPSSESKPPRSS